MNLASQPFVNERPVRRVTAALWAAGVILLVANGWLYWRHYSGSHSTGERLAEIAARIEEEQSALNALRTELESFDLVELNREARWVNARIAARTFSWSSLFDRVGEVLPGDVRLSSLSPRFYRENRRDRGEDEGGGGDVELSIRGTARKDTALLALMDALFEHPAFFYPDLSNEARRDDGTVDFTLTVVYRPTAPVPAVPAPEATEGGATDAEAAGTAAEERS